MITIDDLRKLARRELRETEASARRGRYVMNGYDHDGLLIEEEVTALDHPEALEHVDDDAGPSATDTGGIQPDEP